MEQKPRPQQELGFKRNQVLVDKLEAHKIKALEAIHRYTSERFQTCREVAGTFVYLVSDAHGQAGLGFGFITYVDLLDGQALQIWCGHVRFERGPTDEAWTCHMPDLSKRYGELVFERRSHVTTN